MFKLYNISNTQKEGFFNALRIDIATCHISAITFRMVKTSIELRYLNDNPYYVVRQISEYK